MHVRRLWRRLAGVQQAVVERVEDQVDRVVVHVRLWRSRRLRCGVCGEVSSGHDQGAGRRHWRSLDLGTLQVFVEADAPRVRCGSHGVVVAQFPWARHQSRFTRGFEDQACWLVTHTSRRAVSQLLRIDWATVGRMVERVVQEAGSPLDRVKQLLRIGVDEVSFRRGHRYLTVVVDHDSGVLLWASEGRDKATLQRFFDLIGPEKCSGIKLITADAAAWFRVVLQERCPQARICMDAFHVVAWATAAVDEVRRQVWRDARRAGHRTAARTATSDRFVVWKNPENLTQRQGARLADIERTNKPLYRAYLLKELLRECFVVKGKEGIKILAVWLSWACRCRIPAFVKLSRTIRRERTFIEAALEERMSNARVEGVNTRIRLATRIAFGFRTVKSLIATVMLTCGGLCPALPGRS